MEDKHGRAVSEEIPRREFKREFEAENVGILESLFEIVQGNIVRDESKKLLRGRRERGRFKVFFTTMHLLHHW